MAETLTMEPNVEKTSIDNLSAEEQDSLQVGEQMQEAQENLSLIHISEPTRRM